MHSLKKLSVLLAVLILLVSIVSGCGGKPTATDKPPEAKKEMKMTMATLITPAYDDLFPPMQGYVDYINQKGKGKVQIDYYHSEKLLKANDLLTGLMQGSANLIFHTDSYITGTLPIFGIVELPFLYKDQEDLSKKTRIGTPLYNLINEELAKKNLFMIATMALPPEHIWAKKPMKSPADFKGQRIRTAGLIEAKFIEAMGGASTTLSSGELYDALKKGTVDGLISYPGTVAGRSLQEVTKFGTVGFFGSYTEVVLIKLDEWKKLPKDVQDLLLEAGKEYEAKYDFVSKVHREKAWPSFTKAGMEKVELTPEEIKQYREAVKPLYEWWKSTLPPGVGDKALDLATK